uniref:Fibrinogen C-terminal domain-containing protein n=1 Tax=Glossina austeni TaxID=7395 RepID=A0A1A9UJI1_GLOAU
MPPAKVFANLTITLYAIIIVMHFTGCHMQELSATSRPPAPETHWQQRTTRPPTTRNTATRWRAAPNPNTYNCDYKDLLTKMHDRVNLLVSMDEDQRKHLDNIDKKIVQFEASNLARMESLAVQQLNFHKRIDVVEHMQRLTRQGVDELLGEFETYRKKLNHTDQSHNNKANIDLNELNTVRKARQLPQQYNQTTLLGSGGGGIGDNDFSNSQKLNAMAVFLVSLRTAVKDLQNDLQTNVTRLLQQTGNLQRRFNNLMRRQLNQLGYLPAQLAPASQPQLVTSCGQSDPPVRGVLRLQLTGSSEPFYAMCDSQSLGGGWTVIMNRFNGDINFERGWLDYKYGFGNLAGEFFIGLDKLYALTAVEINELVILLEDFQGNRKYARYNLFAIGNEQEMYELKLLGKYEGDAGDSFSYHAGSKFSTYDNDNDGCVDCNCAQSHKGAWWYNWCDQSNLMGPYHATDYNKIEQYRGIYWQDWLGPTYSLKAAKMMIRPINWDQDARRR